LRAVTTATRLHDAIAELAQCNDEPGAGGITREVYTPTYGAALERVAGWMREAALDVRLDAVANLFGRWEGGEPGAPRVLTGSHVDTTLNAGRDDGVLGVLGAIEAVHLLRDAGTAPRRSIELVAWAGEEPRFGTGCAGSRAAAGQLGRADLDRLRDREGTSMAAALREAGFDPDRLPEAEIDPAGVHALVELHIEQGAVLEDGGEPIGVVTAIAAPHDFALEVQPIVEDIPVACEQGVIEAAEAAARELGLPFRRMTSGAYHDAMIMGARVPIGMIFVPSAGGISHHPDEYTAPEELENGVRVLAGTLARLAA
jgi:acetylornithine deacetylase/succinyl-diaminopimelate desuccinylase-like protein